MHEGKGIHVLLLLSRLHLAGQVDWKHAHCGEGVGIFHFSARHIFIGTDKIKLDLIARYFFELAQHIIRGRRELTEAGIQIVFKEYIYCYGISDLLQQFFCSAAQRKAFFIGKIYPRMPLRSEPIDEHQQYQHKR